LSTGGVLTSAGEGARQWYAAGSPIIGATGATYTVVAADSGVSITCRNAAGSSNAIVVPAISHWLDQSASALDFAQAAAGEKPKADGGAVYFAGGQGLVQGTTTVTSGATTVGMRAQLTALPGAGDAAVLGLMAMGGNKWHLQIASALGGAYPPRAFAALLGTAVIVGVADALTTAEERTVITHSGGSTTDPAAYAYYLAGVSKAVVVGGLFGLTSALGDANALGVLPRSPGIYRLTGCIYTRVVYSAALNAAGCAALDALLADPASTYAQYAALGTVVCCLLPGVGWS
jgi:hypothetical protein